MKDQPKNDEFTDRILIAKNKLNEDTLLNTL